jgi:hypothetical protein
MINRQRKTTSDDKKSAEKGKHQAGETGGENCRCKEVSKKTVPELLKTMIGDLAFWKKGK